MNDPSVTHITYAKNSFDNYKQELLPDHRSGNNNKLLTNGYGTYDTLTYTTSARSSDNRIGLA